MKNKSHTIACNFEKKHGHTMFLKTALSAITKVLVKKGVVTENELQDSFISETKNYGNRNKN